jgi:acyl-coenzyme A synthetase/AMP-(fatty) acid ligase
MHCPACHAEHDESADVCCARATITWHCTSCAKFSEGFAFPYGACPLCGGALVLFQPDPVRDPPAMRAVRKAFEIELGGQAFYHQAAARTDDPALRRLFGRFAAMEREHMRTLARRYHVDMTPLFDRHAVERGATFAGIDGSIDDAEQLFRVAIGLEERAAAFLEASSAAVAPGSSAQRLYRELAAEEREHVQQLRAEHARWRSGHAGALAGIDDALVKSLRESAATMNAAEVLLAGDDGARIALRCGRDQMTRGELRDAVARAGAAWRTRGLARGERVAVKLPDGLDWIVAYLGVIWAGGVAVGVNPRVPDVEWQAILDAAGFRFILAEQADAAPAPWAARVVTLEAWRDAIARASPCAAEPMDAEDPVLWVHSSGTSGRPKAVVHPQRIVHEIDRVGRERLGLREDDRIYASSKLFFSYPLANVVLTGLKLGATIVLDPQWPTAQRVLATVTAANANVVFSVPSLYRNLVKEGLAADLARRGVRLYVSAGEALPASLRDEWKRQTGRTIVDGFGASETLVLVLVDVGDGEGLQTSPGIDIDSFDGSHAQGAPGRIAIRGSTVALGYWNRPDAQAEHFRDGAFVPSDLFERTATGWRFAGREDSLVKVHGRWVDLLDLEQRMARTCPAIVEAACVSVADDDGVEAIALFFVAQENAPPVDDSALRDNAGRLPPHQRPRWLHRIDALPRTPTGKLQRRVLRDMHATLAAGASHDTGNEIRHA